MRSILAALLLALAVGAASAQPGRGPPSLPPTAKGPEKMRTAPPNAPDAKGQEVQRRARELRRAARRDAADGYRAADVLAAYERDTVGQWFRRGEIVLVGANPAVMATAAGMGLTERRRTALTSTG